MTAPGRDTYDLRSTTADLRTTGRVLRPDTVNRRAQVAHVDGLAVPLTGSSTSTSLRSVNHPLHARPWHNAGATQTGRPSYGCKLQVWVTYPNALIRSRIGFVCLDRPMHASSRKPACSDRMQPTSPDFCCPESLAGLTLPWAAPRAFALSNISLLRVTS